jgi:hypothetical protein
MIDEVKKEAQKALDELTPKVGLIARAIKGVEDARDSKVDLEGYAGGDEEHLNHIEAALEHLNQIRDNIMEEVMRQKAIIDPPIED